MSHREKTFATIMDTEEYESPDTNYNNSYHLKRDILPHPYCCAKRLMSSYISFLYITQRDSIALVRVNRVTLLTHEIQRNAYEIYPWEKTRHDTSI